MNDPAAKPADFAKTVAIVGVGLIGGSLAAALKQRNFPGQIIGVGRNPERLAKARKLGLLDDFSEQIGHTRADLWVFCTPVDRIVAGVLEVKPQLGQTTLITDAGSVKGEICEEVRGRLPAGIEFIGSHPLAGSEQRGFEHADAELFVDRLCVLTPEKSSSQSQLDRLHRFWKFLGMRTQEMTAADHDRALAETSHLPHLIASVLAGTLQTKNTHLAATGFADTTRIAAGDPDLWTAIFLQNAAGTGQALERFSDRLEQFRQALNRRDATALQNLLQHAKTKREEIPMTNDQ